MAKRKTDYRRNQKVIATIELEDKGQDFPEIDVLENGVVLGYSVMFEDGKRSLLGIGTTNGTEYYTFKDFVKMRKVSPDVHFTGLFVYLQDTANKIPILPWNAYTLKYAITGVKKAVKPNRFIIRKANANK